MNLEFLGCINCLVAVGMFSGMLYLMLNYRKSIVLKNFIDTLSPELLEIYQDVSYERMTIYIQGMVFGLIIGLIYLNYANQNRINRACTFTVILLGINLGPSSISEQQFSRLSKRIRPVPTSISTPDS